MYSLFLLHLLSVLRVRKDTSAQVQERIQICRKEREEKRIQEVEIEIEQRKEKQREKEENEKYVLYLW